MEPKTYPNVAFCVDRSGGLVIMPLETRFLASLSISLPSATKLTHCESKRQSCYATWDPPFLIGVPFTLPWRMMGLSG